MNDTRFFNKLERLDRLMSKPASEAMEEFIQLAFKSDVTLNYAFTKLEREDWVRPLKEAGCLANPPDIFTDKNGNLHAVNIWPQADYLKRMAQQDDLATQKQILEIMLEVGGTNNYFIHQHFTEAALSMPIHLAEEWGRHEAEWLRAGNRIYGMLEDKLGQMISKMANEGRADVALKLASELLDILPEPHAEKKIHSEKEPKKLISSALEPRIRCDPYAYEEILKKDIPDLAKTAPFETLEMLCGLLEKAIIYSRSAGEKEKPEDFSYIYRPAIEDHEQNHDYRVDCHLISGVRDAAEAICKSQPQKIVEVVKQIEDREWYVFQRIGLHLLRVVEHAPVQMISERILNKQLFDCSALHHEYFHLLKKYYAQLPDEGRDKILDWVEIAEEAKAYLLHTNDLTAEQRERRLKWWRYRKLIPIQEYLLGEWKERFSQLKVELGEPEIPPDFQSWVGTQWISPLSPKEPEELAQMTVGELVDYLKKWEPSGDRVAPTPDGLGSMLGGLVAENPEKFALEIERFMCKAVDPIYVRHLISGFCRALENGKTLPYENVFKLCKWVVDQPTKITGAEIPERLLQGIEKQTEWRQIRHEIARIFEKIFDDKLGLPYALRETAWQIIEPLSNDPEPDLQYEERYGGDKLDPLTLSINTIRGKALHGVMSYTMWVCRRTKDAARDKVGKPSSFGEMREVRYVLEKHLDFQKSGFSKNLTDRAVYGQWLPQLVHVDIDWVKKNLKQIFPAEPEHKRLREAVWNSYLMYSSLYDQVYEVIKDIYREEVVGLVNKSIKGDVYRNPETKLTEHVVVLYARGKVSLDEGDLVDLFFRGAPLELTAHVMDFVGRSMKGEIPQQFVERFKNLWDWRINKVKGTSQMPDKELSAFGWWFASGRCGENWSFPYLEKTLERTGLSRSSADVFKYMNSIFAKYPGQSLRCLRLFIDRNDDPWFFSTRKKEGFWQVLEQGIANEDLKIRENAETIIHLLGSKGYLEYRELLK